MSVSIKRDKQEDVRIREIHVNISEVKSSENYGSFYILVFSLHAITLWKDFKIFYGTFMLSFLYFIFHLYSFLLDTVRVRYGTSKSLI